MLLLSASFSFTSAETADVDTSSDNSCAIITSNLRYLTRDASGSTDVLVLQDFLNTHGYLKSQPTGFFGSATRRAVIAFQNDNNLRATPPGYVGPGTRAKIKEIDCNDTTAVNTMPVETTSNMSVPPVTVFPAASATLKQSLLSATEKQTVTISGTASNVSSLNITIKYPNGAILVRTTPVINGAWSETYEGFPNSGNYTITISRADYQTGTILANGSLKVTGNTGVCSIDYPEGANIRSSTQSNANECKSYCDTFGYADAASHGGATVCKFKESKIESYRSAITPSINTFSASPSQIVAGQPVTLSWTSSLATKCGILKNSNTWEVMNLGTSGSYKVYPTVSTTYTLSCIGTADGTGKDAPGAERTAYVTVTTSTTTNPEILLFDNGPKGPPTTAEGPSVGLSFSGISANGSSVNVRSGGGATNINPLLPRVWSWSARGASSVKADYNAYGTNCPSVWKQDNWEPWVGTSVTGDRFEGSNTRIIGPDFYGCTISITYSGKDNQGRVAASSIKISFMEKQ